MDNNDNLMKIHKEILDQKSKMERAERQMKSSRKDVSQNLNDQEFLSNFDVTNPVININISCNHFQSNSLERLRCQRNGTTKRCCSSTAC